MSFNKTVSLTRSSLLSLSVLALTACGFHLRKDAVLPPAMQRVHLDVSGGNSPFQRELARALQTSGVDIEQESGPGVAELQVSEAAFGSDKLTGGGYVRITENAVNFDVRFDVQDDKGNVLVPIQTITLQHEYSSDARDLVGNASEVKQIQASLQDDMVQAILFRLEAAGKRRLAAPASASSAP